MNHTAILKRAWNILWSYSAIWVFGILLALTSPSGGNGGSSGASSSRRSGSMHPFTLPDGMNRFFENLGQQLNQFFSTQLEPNMVAFIAGVVLFVLLLVAIFTVIRSVSRVALIRMVDQFEATGEKATVGQGFRMGWSRAAWRVFLIDLVIGLPVAIVFIGLFGCALVPVGLSVAFQHQPSVPGIAATVSLFFLLIFLAIVVAALISLVMETIYRVCVLENRGVFDAIGAGWQLVRHNFWNVFLMWLILIGIGIAYAILMIPVFLLLLVLGGLGGGSTGVGLYYLFHALGNETAAWITGVVLGTLLFIAILGLPLLFLGGLKQSYTSTVWTLTYRQLRFGTASTPVAPVATPPQENQPSPAS